MPGEAPCLSKDSDSEEIRRGQRKDPGDRSLPNIHFVEIPSPVRAGESEALGGVVRLLVIAYCSTAR